MGAVSMKGRLKLKVWSALGYWKTAYVKPELVDANAESLTRAGICWFISR